MSYKFYSSPLQENNSKRRRGRNMQKQQAALANSVSKESERVKESLLAGKIPPKGSVAVQVCRLRGLFGHYTREEAALSCLKRAIYYCGSPPLEHATCAHYFTAVNPIRFSLVFCIYNKYI